MSGTSLDGLDICYVHFSEHSEKWNFEILQAETLEYPKSWVEKLTNAFYLSAPELLALNSEYGFYLGEMVKEFIEKNKLEKIDLIASHGHTIFHQPEKKFTLQIGDGRAIKQIANLPVIYDFRMQDVLMGGNGAPLVPIGDQLLFSEFDACINLGGFSNISFLKNGKRIAFDICPVNVILNEFAQKLGKKFDENGALAKCGNTDENLLQELNQLAFYQKNPPKSLGIEWVQQSISPLLVNKNPETILATFTEHIAIQIAKILNENNIEKALITGGGAYNTHLIESLKKLTNSEIIIPSQNLIEYKEALIFALMGVLRFAGRNNVLSSATGSIADHSSGLFV